jgi:hypothetical protein
MALKFWVKTADIVFMEEGSNPGEGYEEITNVSKAPASNLIRIPLMIHIRNRIKRLEQAINGVVALQFAEHPEGLSMVIRVYLPATTREYVYPDVILPFELIKGNEECERVNVLFDLIHKALESVQVVQDKSGGLIHHS